jgi:hypothetical protein
MSNQNNCAKRGCNGLCPEYNDPDNKRRYLKDKHAGCGSCGGTLKCHFHDW